VKKFNDLHVDDQLYLCVEVFRAMFAARAGNICSTAEIRQKTTDELWQQICNEICLEECIPWEGYPYDPLPADEMFWARLKARADDNVRRRVRALQEMMLVCLSSSSARQRNEAASVA
jgi:hypothetical protein